MGALAGSKIGPNSLLKVMAGDKVSATTQYFYKSPVVNSTSSGIVSNVLGSLIQVIGGSTVTNNLTKAASGGINSVLGSSVPFAGATSPDAANTSGNKPKAYLTLLFFDERFNFIPENSTTLRVQTAGNGADPLTMLNIKAPKNGYAYIYVSNESNEHVYFDNLQVTHERGAILEENHYYAYGLKIAAISSRKIGVTGNGGAKNLYQYQGDYSELDEDIGWNDFSLRNYDAQIGRWVQKDPYEQFPSGYEGMGNNPINFNDPSGGAIASGMFSGMGQLGKSAVMTFTGAVLGGIIGGILGGDEDDKGWSRGFGIGATIGLTGSVAYTFFGQVLHLFMKIPATKAGEIKSISEITGMVKGEKKTAGTNNNSGSENIIKIYIKHGQKTKDGGDNSVDILDGHTLIQVDNNFYDFVPGAAPEKLKAKADKAERKGRHSLKDLYLYWNADGEAMEDDNLSGTVSYFERGLAAGKGISIFEIKVTPKQKAKLLDNIKASILNPPNYRVLGTRCASWATGVLIDSKILPNAVKLFSWNTISLRNALFRTKNVSLVRETKSGPAPALKSSN